MLEAPDGRIRMTPDEELIYRAFAKGRPLPKTREEFDRVLRHAAASMRERLATGRVRTGDSPVMADLIDIYLRDPHIVNYERGHRDWIEAGHPMGEAAMRKAGLSSAALDFYQERDAGSEKSG